MFEHIFWVVCTFFTIDLFKNKIFSMFMPAFSFEIVYLRNKALNMQTITKCVHICEYRKYASGNLLPQL